MAEQTIFDNLVDDDPIVPPQNEKKEDKPKSSDPVQTLQEENKKLKEQVQSLAARSEEQSKISDGLKKIFDPSADKTEQERDLRSRFEADPFGFVQSLSNNVKDEVRKEMREEMQRSVLPLQAENNFQRSRSWVDQRYNVEWDNPDVQRKVSKQLENVSDKMKREEPNKALLQACAIAGVLSDKAPTPNYIEGSDGQVNIQAVIKEGQEQKQRVMEIAKRKREAKLI